MGVFNYYVKKEGIILEGEEESSFEEIIEKIENLGVDESLLPFYDYGFPKEMIDKLEKLELPLEKCNIDELSEFDNYEKIMIKEFFDIIE